MHICIWKGGLDVEHLRHHFAWQEGNLFLVVLEPTVAPAGTFIHVFPLVCLVAVGLVEVHLAAAVAGSGPSSWPSMKTEMYNPVGTSSGFIGLVNSLLHSSLVAPWKHMDLEQISWKSIRHKHLQRNALMFQKKSPLMSSFGTVILVEINPP